MKAPATNNNYLLGVDPGYDRLGIAVLGGTISKPVLIWSTCVTPPKGDPSERLAVVHAAITKAIKEYKPYAVAIETLFFSRNTTTALKVAEARGVILAAAGTAQIPVIECSPQEVKLSVTGYGRADKRAIAQFLPHILTLPSKKKRFDDELDAIAVALAAQPKMGRGT